MVPEMATLTVLGGGMVNIKKLDFNNIVKFQSELMKA